MTNKILLLIIISLVIIGFLISEELSFIYNYYDSYAKIRYKTLTFWIAQLVSVLFILRLFVIKLRKHFKQLGSNK
jgi:hypothetical protein